MARRSRQWVMVALGMVVWVFVFTAPGSQILASCLGGVLIGWNGMGLWMEREESR